MDEKTSFKENKVNYLGTYYYEKPDNFTGIKMQVMNSKLGTELKTVYFKARKVQMPARIEITNLRSSKLGDVLDIIWSSNKFVTIDVYKDDEPIYRFAVPPHHKYLTVVAMFFLGTVATYDYYTANIDRMSGCGKKNSTDEEYWKILLNNTDTHLNAQSTNLYTGTLCGNFQFDCMLDSYKVTTIVAHSNSMYKCGFFSMWTGYFVRKEGGAIMVEGYPGVTKFAKTGEPVHVVYTVEDGTLVYYEPGVLDDNDRGYNRYELRGLNKNDIVALELQGWYDKLGKKRPEQRMVIESSPELTIIK